MSAGKPLWGSRAGLGAVAVMLSLLAACSSTPKDETAGMSNEKLYAEARDEAAAGNYERAIRLYERLEGRTAGTLMSQLSLIHISEPTRPIG